MIKTFYLFEYKFFRFYSRFYNLWKDTLFHTRNDSFSKLFLLNVHWFCFNYQNFKCTILLRRGRTRRELRQASGGGWTTPRFIYSEKDKVRTRHVPKRKSTRSQEKKRCARASHVTNVTTKYTRKRLWKTITWHCVFHTYIHMFYKSMWSFVSEHLLILSGCLEPMLSILYIGFQLIKLLDILMVVALGHAGLAK